MIERLTGDTPEQLERLGGKGCGLVRLMRAGFAVPETWILPARTVEARLSGDGRLQDKLRQALHHFWITFQTEFPGSRLAVRSSATAEDLEEASFAGIYRTVLNVTGAEALIAAVEKCLEALVSQEASVYRARHGIAPEQQKIALVLQRMVDPDVAGVLLTTNPMRPFANEGAINAAYGLGEAIVSGLTHPDEIIFDKATNAVIRRKVGPKTKEIRFLRGKGQIQRTVRKARRDRLSLEEERILKLVKLCRDVETRIGPRQDCEWAFEKDRLYVLQQRPITGLPPQRPRDVWSRKFGDEYLAEYTLPLGYTLLGGWISEVFLEDFAKKLGFAGQLSHAPTRRYKGYAYISGEYIKYLLSSAPRGMRRVESLGWFTPLWEDRIRAEPFRPLQLIRAVGTVLLDPFASTGRNPEELRLHAAAIEQRIVPKLLQDYSLLTEAEWEQQFQDVMVFGIRHFRIIRWGMGVYNPFFHGLLQLLLHKWCDQTTDELYQAIIAGLPGTRTTQINRAIWELGVTARREKALRRGILDHRSVASLRASFAPFPFWDEFDRFLARYGHRSASREIATPSWHETPEAVIGFVRAQLVGKQPEDPRLVEEATGKRRSRAEQEASRLAGHGVSGPLRRTMLGKVIKTTQRYTQYRENQRFYLDYILDHIRRLILEMARRLTEKGLLDSPDDVFFLDAQTFQSVRTGGGRRETVQNIIAEQRQEYLLWRHRIPATFLFDGIETEGEVAEGPARSDEGNDRSSLFTGTPASAGTTAGTVRVIPTVAEIDQIRPGEILVASNTDPGWTSVFPRLGGLITETGGMLSHGALVAREYGIPAVTGVARATRLLSTGQRVRLDGRTGRVVLLAPEGSSNDGSASPSRQG